MRQGEILTYKYSEPCPLPRLKEFWASSTCGKENLKAWLGLLYEKQRIDMVNEEQGEGILLPITG